MASITDVIPQQGSPIGGLLLTIVGHNLKSTQLDIGGVKEESESEGENFKVWFEHPDTEERPNCHIDRMFALHAQPLEGQDFLICQTPAMPIFDSWQVRLSIDDGPALNGGSVRFLMEDAPSVDYFFPQAGAPAQSKSQWDYEGAFWTGWYDLDTNATDDVEDESFAAHFAFDRETFQQCLNPIGIEVFNLDTDSTYVASSSQNADGHTVPTYMNVHQGFKCENAAQTIDPDGNLYATCPNVKVRLKNWRGLSNYVGELRHNMRVGRGIL